MTSAGQAPLRRGAAPQRGRCAPPASFLSQPPPRPRSLSKEDAGERRLREPGRTLGRGAALPCIGAPAYDHPPALPHAPMSLGVTMSRPPLTPAAFARQPGCLRASASSWICSFSSLRFSASTACFFCSSDAACSFAELSADCLSSACAFSPASPAAQPAGPSSAGSTNASLSSVKPTPMSSALTPETASRAPILAFDFLRVLYLASSG
mmetsp:Transcript_26775/g.79895  ORF Transcript_26775/g.79895 Transcript_26775/m.79895 type:complete len:209 (-) Transcript_26775:172-798(-)